VTILHDIVTRKQEELAQSKQRVTLEEMMQLAKQAAGTLSLSDALTRMEIRTDARDGSAFKPIRIIAEIKKASPSRGVIRSQFNPVEIAREYAAGGAAAISVLTESHFFQGRLDYLLDVHKALGQKRPPLMRKDFIFDPYQIFESRVYGADSLLLIAAILMPAQMKELINLSRSLCMEPLIEIHNPAELDIALACGAMIIGINNRDLNTFKVDINTTARLRPLIPEDRLIVSESGISERQQIRMLEEIGVDAILIGEAMMAAPDIGVKLRELI
jgi:indole-3-glycerol phosphate synthase